MQAKSNLNDCDSFKISNMISFQPCLNISKTPVNMVRLFQIV